MHQQATSVNWDKIDTVLLDMDGTLLDLHFDSFFWMQHLPLRYSQVHSKNLQQVIADVYGPLKEKQGSLEWYCTNYWSKQFNLNIIEMQKEIKHLITERSQALEFLEALGAMDKKRILVTNSDRPSIELKFANTAIEKRLDQTISSHDYGAAKEHQQFWIELQQRVDFDPDTTLFIDDSESVLNSANTFGISHLRSIEKPDSRQIQPTKSHYPAIDQFLSLVNSGDHG